MRMPAQAFILCAGAGTRMLPDTLAVPKCLLNIAGKSVLVRILEWLSLYGVRNILINLHHKANVVVDQLPVSGFEITYSIEDKLYGTAGGIRKCLNSLRDPFYIIYGDVLTNMDLDRLGNFHASRKSDITFASHLVDNPNSCGIIQQEIDGQVLEFEEKPLVARTNLVNAGVLVSNKECFRDIPVDTPWDISHDLIPFLLKTNRVVSHCPLQDNEWLIDIGTRENYYKAIQKYDNL